MSKIRLLNLNKNPELIKRGEESGQSKLTWEEVKEIRNIYGLRLISHEMLANKYEISRRTIGFVLSNKTWYDPDYHPKDISINRRKIGKKDVLEIRRLFLTGQYSTIDIGKMFNVCFQYVYGIVLNKYFYDKKYGKNIKIVKEIILDNKKMPGKRKREFTDNEIEYIKELFLAGNTTDQIQKIMDERVTVGVIRRIVASLRENNES